MGRASRAKRALRSEKAPSGSWSPIPPECPNDNAEHRTHPVAPSGVFLFPFGRPSAYADDAQADACRGPNGSQLRVSKAPIN